MTKQPAPTQKRKRGRPGAPAELRREFNLAFRARKEIREKLERAATESRRSLAAEIEYRLERSLHAESIVLEAFSASMGAQPAALALLLLRTASVAGMWASWD